MNKQYTLEIKTLSEVCISRDSCFINLNKDSVDDGIPSIYASAINGLLIDTAKKLNEEDNIHLDTDFQIRITDAFLENCNKMIDKHNFFKALTLNKLYRNRNNIINYFENYLTIQSGFKFIAILEIEESKINYLKTICSKIKHLGLRRNLGYGEIAVSILN